MGGTVANFNMQEKMGWLDGYVQRAFSSLQRQQVAIGLAFGPSSFDDTIPDR
jgi:hypothetical protein